MDSSIEKPDFGGIAINEAREGTESEQNMTLREGLKLCTFLNPLSKASSS